MRLLLLLLLVSSLAVPPGFSQTYQEFVKRRYIEGTTVNCARDMRKVLNHLKASDPSIRCLSCNTFILGTWTIKAAVNKVCSGEGGVHQGKTEGGHDLYQSKKDFRVLTCKKKDIKEVRGVGLQCVFNKAEEKDIVTKKITLACKDNLPVDFEPCITKTSFWDSFWLKKLLKV